MNLPIFKSLRTISCLNPKILKKCNPIIGTVLKLQTNYSKSSCKNASLPVAHPHESITTKYPLGTGPHKYHWLEIRCSLTGTSLHCNLQVVLFFQKLTELLDNCKVCKGLYKLVPISGEDPNEISNVLMENTDQNRDSSQQNNANSV